MNKPIFLSLLLAVPVAVYAETQDCTAIGNQNVSCNKAKAKRYWKKAIKLYKTIGSSNEKVVQGWLDNLK